MDDPFTIRVDKPEDSTNNDSSSSEPNAKNGGVASTETKKTTFKLNEINPKDDSDEDWTEPKDMDFLFAARIVKDARDLRNLTFKKTEHNLRSYERYLDIRMRLVLYATICVHLILLPLMEAPAVIKVAYWVPCCIELVCLTIYSLRWMNARAFQTTESFKSDKKNLVVMIVVLLIFLDIIMFIVANETSSITFRHRYTRPLRVLIYINFNEGKELRRAIRNVRKTLPDIFNVFSLFFLSVFMFSFVAWNLFQGKNGEQLFYANNQSYFYYFEDSIWDLYISVTTANFPDVMMPAYDRNGFYAIFFIAFMLINLYIFINIILATIYTNYKKHLKEDVRVSLELKRNKAKDAFDLIKFPLRELAEYEKKLPSPPPTDQQNLDEQPTDVEAPETTTTKTNIESKFTELVKSEFEFVINYNVFEKLMKHVKPTYRQKQIKLLFDILDSDKNGLLAFKEFVFLPDLLNIRLTEVKDRETLFERYIPNVYNSKPSKLIKNLTRHTIFQMFFDTLILINMIFVFLRFSERIEWFFLVAYLIEITMKIWEAGFVKFSQDYWNVFDSVIVSCGIIAGIVDEASGESESGAAGIFEIVLILRSLRLLKFVASIHRFRTIITTIAIITPSLVNYGLLLLTIFYMFSMLGMELFSDAIKDQVFQDRDTYNCYNPRLENTDFVRFKYCKNNFASFPNSMVLLFELMVVNQWHILSRGFEDATGTKYTRLFFFAFHISCVIVSLNIFTAFVIEAFLLEYENSDDLKSDSVLETRIKKMGLNYELDSHDDKKLSQWAEIKEFFRSLKDIFDLEDEMASSAFARRGTGIDKTHLGSQGVRFHINSREPKSVDVLLQRMFSKEFDIQQDNLLIDKNKSAKSAK